jgi:peptide/nickel transport system substrate-binding protein
MIRTSLAALLVLVLAACGDSGDDGQRKEQNLASGGTYTTSISTDPGNLDPAKLVNNTAALVTSFAYDTLVGIDGSGNPVPQLASKWDVTPTSVTFTLREGITCGDGSPLTARQVAANFEFAKDPKNETAIIGVDLPDTEFTVAADDSARTVTISRKQPYGFLLPGAGDVPIVCAKGMADRKLLARGTDGTGPFKLVEAVPGDHYTLEARKDYAWGPNGATTDVDGFPAKVVVKVVQSSDTAVNLMLNNQLNDATVVGTERKRMEGRGYEEQKTPGSPIDMFFNQAAGHPGADPAVRRALVSAVNSEQLRKVLTENDSMEPTSLVVNEPKPCKYDSVKGNLPPHDAAAAKSILDEAGWTAGAGGVRAKGGTKLQLTLLYPSGTPSVDAGLELLAGWWKEIGAEVQLKPTDANAMNEILFSNPGAWDVSMMGIGTAYPSQLVAFFSGSAPPDGQNFSAIANSAYTTLIGEAGRTPGQPGCELWGKAEQELIKRLDVVPISVSIVRTYLNKVRYAVGSAGPEPTSIRLLAG